jgi:hypothetical protein
MKDHLKLSGNVTDLEKRFNKTIPEFTFLRNIIREDNFIVDLIKDINEVTKFDGVLNTTAEIILMCALSPIWVISEITKKKYNIDFFQNIIRRKLFFSKKKKQNVLNVLDKYKKDLNFYNETMGEDNKLSNLLSTNGNFTSNEIKYNEIRLESADYIQNKVDEMFLVFKEDEDKFLKAYLTYAKIRKDQENGSNYFSLLFQDHLNRKEKEKNNKKSKAKIININNKL